MVLTPGRARRRAAGPAHTGTMRMQPRPTVVGDPNSVRPGSAEGVPIPEALHGLAIEIVDRLSYTPTIPGTILRRYTGDGPERALRESVS